MTPLQKAAKAVLDWDTKDCFGASDEGYDLLANMREAHEAELAEAWRRGDHLNLL